MVVTHRDAFAMGVGRKLTADEEVTFLRDEVTALKTVVDNHRFEIDELRQALWSLSRRVPHPDDVFGPRVHPQGPFFN